MTDRETTQQIFTKSRAWKTGTSTAEETIRFWW